MLSIATLGVDVMWLVVIVTAGNGLLALLVKADSTGGVGILLVSLLHRQEQTVVVGVSETKKYI